MNLEIQYISEVLQNSEDGLMTKEFAKMIRDKYNYRITKTKVKIYLCSQFANDISIDDQYRYTLRNNVTRLDRIEVIKRKQPRAINFIAEGNTLKAYYSDELTIASLVHAVAAVSSNINPASNTTDLTVRINREIDSIK